MTVIYIHDTPIVPNQMAAVVASEHLPHVQKTTKMATIHTEKCLVGFTIRWLIELHDLVSYKATTYLVVVTNSDSCIDLGNTTICLVTLPIIGSYNYY